VTGQVHTLNDHNLMIHLIHQAAVAGGQSETRLGRAASWKKYQKVVVIVCHKGLPTEMKVAQEIDSYRPRCLAPNFQLVVYLEPVSGAKLLGVVLQVYRGRMTRHKPKDLQAKPKDLASTQTGSEDNILYLINIG
jgi:hypothetical protein